MKRIAFLLMMFIQCAVAQDSPHGNITIPCESCHTSDSWKMRPDASFDHKSTGFELEGRHKVIQCASCHENLVFTQKNTAQKNNDCTTCHTDVHKSDLGPNCLQCHSMESWIISDIKQMHQQTRFPLIGRHALADCNVCHSMATPHQYTGTPLTCIGCHRPEYEATTSPNHVTQHFTIDCSQCHAITAPAWPGSFNHNLTTFPLTGAHQAVLCLQCHINSQFNGITTDCYSCHMKDFANVQSPNHITGGFSHACQTCHTTSAWNPATFDHNATRFPLTGAHQTVLCQACHTNGNYQLVYSSCAQCHNADFQGTTNPSHVAGNFSMNCQTCHNTVAWQPATFDHSTTKFPLTGAHQAVLCQTCHTNNNYQLVYSSCVQCHNSDFQGATNPNHVSGGFSTNCTTCHSTTAWQPATFDHSTTKFPLTGAHQAVLCQTCHTNGNYQLVYSSCVQCHNTDFQGATNPNHVSGGFSTNCQTCHSTTAWQPATFDHSTTKFPLTGAHQAVLCQTCHTNGNYQLVYSSCIQCHNADFIGATNPNHVSGGFSTNCTTCHSTTAWQPATFDHSTTNFPLTGAHTSVLCQTCHTNGNYQLVYSGCYSCHTTDYSGTTNPNHTAAGFPTTCQTCHTTTAWTGATFNHTWFPTSHGNAGGVCATCHTNPSDYTVFQCTVCHTQSTTASDHSRVSGYVWNSANCYQCHPNGKGG